MRNRVVSRTVYTNHVHVVDVVPNGNGEIEQNDKGIIDVIGEFRGESKLLSIIKNMHPEFKNPIIVDKKRESNVYEMSFEEFMQNAHKLEKSTTPVE